MRRRRGVRGVLVMSVALMALLGFVDLPTVFAQEAGQGQGGDKAQRERELRQKLQTILDELEELKRAPEGSPTIAGPSVVEKQEVPEGPAGTPRVELKDMSIVSQRAQKRPEGVSISATPRTEHDSQPTRHMRESLESLPGVIVRQANGPRDFSISIRGSGVKTTFAIRDLKMYEDGIIQTQSDGLSRMDLHDPLVHAKCGSPARRIVLAL